MPSLLPSADAVLRAIYAPPDWLVEHTSARDRRTFGFYCIVVSVLLFPIFGDKVRYVSILSLVALIPNVSSETPVEEE